MVKHNIYKQNFFLSGEGDGYAINLRRSTVFKGERLYHF